MDDPSPQEGSDTTARSDFPRGIVFTATAIGLAVGLFAAIGLRFDPIVRWALLPLAAASAAAVIGFALAVRTVRRTAVGGSVMPVPPPPHQLPRPAARSAGLALGPDPWRAASEAGGDVVQAEPLPPDPVELRIAVDEGPTRNEPVLHLLSHDGLRYLRPSEHELERARRAVAKVVADLAPQPGAFDAVCERLLAVGEPMAIQLTSLGRVTTDYEKQLGVDLVDRLSDTRVTETGLAVLTWVRWARAALHPEGGPEAEAFYDPVAVAMASRYGGSSVQWHAALGEPVVGIELGGIVEKIALAVKSAVRPHTVLPDPDAVDRILETPQWM